MLVLPQCTHVPCSQTSQSLLDVLDSRHMHVPAREAPLTGPAAAISNET